MGDTIVAQATPSGESALALIRLSGELCLKIIKESCGLPYPTPRHAYYKKYISVNNDTIDQVVVTYYEEKKSFTSERSLEITCHGNPIIVRSIIEDLLDRGCRIAKPGEFTLKSYLNGKIDLIQAEAIADLIGAKSKIAIELANKNLNGELSDKISRIQSKCIEQQAIIEAFIDFPEDDIGSEQTENVIKELEKSAKEIKSLLDISERCDIFTDVDGIYTTDPRICARARKLEKISYEEMLELASLGAKVLQTRSVELATRFKVRLRVLSSFTDNLETQNGTYVCSEGEIMENKVIAGVAFSRDEAKVTITGIEDRPGIAAIIFSRLSEQSVNVDMIVQNISENGLTDMTFSCPTDQIARAKEALLKDKESKSLRYNKLIVDEEIAKVSIVGIGMKAHAGIAKMMFEALARERINIMVISTSEIKISVLVKRKYLELAVQSLHDTFDLEKA